MRFSLGQVGDVEVTPGATLAECRGALDALLGPSAGAALSVSGHLLVPEQVAGLPPWLPGSHVDVGPARHGWGGPVDPAVLASAPWHAAVVAGPDAGAVAAPGPDGRLSLGRGPGPSEDDARLALSDPAVSRRHALLLTGRRGVTVRDVGSANRTWLRRGPRRTRVGRALRSSRGTGRARWRAVRRHARLRAGDRLRLGGTELELRDEVTPPPSGASSGPWPGASPGASPGAVHAAGTTAGGEPGARAGRVAAAVAPLLVAGAMAAVLHSPVFLLMAAVGPVVAVVPAISARLARRRAGTPLPDLGPDAAALTVLLARGCTDLPAWWPLARDGLAVLADDDARGAVGRVLVGGALLDPTVALTLLAGPAASAGWSWARWVAPRLGGEPGARVAAAGKVAVEARAGRHLVVADGPGAWRTDLDRWWLAGAGPAGTGPASTERADRAALVLLGPGTERPAWCRWLLTLTDDRAHLSGPGVARDLPAPQASLAWAEAFARRLAQRDAAAGGRPGTDAGPASPLAETELPARVGPGDVGLPCDVDAVVETWGAGAAGRRALPGLRVPLGLASGPRGVRTTWLDLLTDGPHALVAGTTGAGKSELLQAHVLGLALRHPPAELGLVLLDFKGGTGLRACADLPHVVGLVSDLDPEQAVRALEALGAELRRREALLAAAGVGDLESLRCRTAGGGPAVVPPRLLVVVDEFRALAEDLPDFVPALVRLAAQGRSLGMHLVLATQRPAGAVTAQMRANLALRICLRVTEPGESRDVVDVPDAADLPASSPGRAVVRRADGAPETVQTTWVALPARRRPPVRPALPWASFGTQGRGVADATSGAPSGATSLAGLVTAAAERLGVPHPAPLWTPPLPALVGRQEIADAVGAAAAPLGDGPAGGRTSGPTAPPGLVLGLTDPPGAGRRGLLTWDGVGLLLVAGAAGSGRTTAAARAGIAALAAGRDVHAVGPVAALLPHAHPGLGTTVDDRDPRRLARLLTLLAAGTAGPGRPGGAGTVLLVDDLAAASTALERLPRGAGSDLVERLARDAARRGVGLLVTGHPRDVARLAPLASARLVLPVADAGDDGLLGVPRELSGRTLPGRAVLVAGGTARRCHVATPEGPGGPHGRPAGAPAPLRLRPIPERVPRTPGVRRTASTAGWQVTVGAGGDDAGPVAVDARRGVLVVGPGGSGRSSALATLALGLAEAGRSVSVVARDGALTALAGRPGLRCVGAAEAAALAAPAAGGAGRPFDVLVIDDLDLLARSSAELDDRLAAWVHAAERGDPAPAVLASCRTDRAAAAYRGTVAALRGAVPTLVLSPGEPGSAEAAGADVAAGCDPTLAWHPGRGVLVVRGRLTPVQVAGPP